MYYYVYILICNNNKHYTGCTSNLKERLGKHFNGYVESTKNLRPLKLHCYFSFIDKQTAFKFEKYLKSGSGRAFANKHFGFNKSI